MSVHLPPFDPSRDFKAIRFFRYDGVIYSRGDAFPIIGLPERKSRQLYETRHIAYAEDEQVRPVRAKRPDPAPLKAPRRGGAGPIAQLIGGFLDAVRRHPQPETEELSPDEETEPLDLETESADRAALVKRLRDGFNRDELLKQAEGLDVPESASKAQIAEALVAAGRGGADGPA